VESKGCDTIPVLNLVQQQVMSQVGGSWNRMVLPAYCCFIVTLLYLYIYTHITATERLSTDTFSI